MRITVVLVIVVLLFLASCLSWPTCIKPYTLSDGACCEDRNENKVCDSKEIAKVDLDVKKEVAMMVGDNVSVSQLDNESAELGKESDILAAQEINRSLRKETLNLTLPAFAYAIRTLELPVLERRAIVETDVAFMIRALTRSKLSALHFDSGYVTNWTNVTSVVNVVLDFRAVSDAETAFEEIRNHYLLEERFDKNDFRQIYSESARMTLNDHTIVLIRRANVISILSMIDADEEAVIAESEAALATSKTPKLLVDVLPVRTSEVMMGPYSFKDATYKDSDGVYVGIADIVFKKKGDDWGEVTSFKIIVDNRGSEAIQPEITISIFEPKEDNPSSQDVELPEIQPGEYAWQVFNSSMTVAGLAKVKSVRAVVFDGSVRSKPVLVSVTKDHTFS